MVNKIADDWIRTADLWWRKRTLYQLRHNHFMNWFAASSVSVLMNILLFKRSKLSKPGIKEANV